MALSAGSGCPELRDAWALTKDDLEVLLTPTKLGVSALGSQSRMVIVRKHFGLNCSLQRLEGLSSVAMVNGWVQQA